MRFTGTVVLQPTIFYISCVLSHCSSSVSLTASFVGVGGYMHVVRSQSLSLSTVIIACVHYLIITG